MNGIFRREQKVSPMQPQAKGAPHHRAPLLVTDEYQPTKTTTPMIGHDFAGGVHRQVDATTTASSTNAWESSNWETDPLRVQHQALSFGVYQDSTSNLSDLGRSNPLGDVNPSQWQATASTDSTQRTAAMLLSNEMDIDLNPLSHPSLPSARKPTKRLVPLSAYTNPTPLQLPPNGFSALPRQPVHRRMRSDSSCTGGDSTSISPMPQEQYAYEPYEPYGRVCSPDGASIVPGIYRRQSDSALTHRAEMGRVTSQRRIRTLDRRFPSAQLQLEEARASHEMPLSVLASSREERRHSSHLYRSVEENGSWVFGEGLSEYDSDLSVDMSRLLIDDALPQGIIPRLTPNSAASDELYLPMELGTEPVHPWLNDSAEAHRPPVGMMHQTERQERNWTNAASRFISGAVEEARTPFMRPRTAEDGFVEIKRRHAAQSEKGWQVKKRVAEFLEDNQVNLPLSKLKETNPGYAQYYVIKSSTPVNIYVALRHGIWSSTELGNRRLTTAFTKQQETIEATGKHTSCVPSVYLFFSVAASGKFCGVAKMTTPVDMSLNMPVWEQAFRWKGMFGIQWIYVKDLPNNAVKHLRVPANENKPVCNSRDTQELPAGVGEFMLKIFAELPMRSTILEDMIKEEIEKHSQ